ncbi:hypothetical protein FisN_30Hu009 [Fistulifera solaris]|uniref:Uncharacterized protein n=1 Tax=Fistulifera solaris TaxID=1519565 RepID=A0A1Z5K6C8_FISSO|nr:hypothetical protein FisN_30Hu009 [Fistulifera solaris]|eukprot:GAX21810.1 hypothetical protein FisN_30Hu009 [Fistulifera solaris]
MSSKSQRINDLLEIIPPCRRTPAQVPHWFKGKDSSPLTYKLLRAPHSLGEFNQYQQSLAIWCDNGTLVYVSPCGLDDFPNDRQEYLSLEFGDKSPSIHIVGRWGPAVARTAAFFMELEDITEARSQFEIINSRSGGRLDFCPAQSLCFTRLFQGAPARHLYINSLTMSAEQSVVLAAQTQSIHLTLMNCIFDDWGTAFVDALQNRQQSFGSLTIESNTESLSASWEKTPFSSSNLRRFLQVDTIKHLTLPAMSGEFALLPFSTKLDQLDYKITFAALLDVDIQDLQIAARKLSLTISFGTFPTELILSFLRRVAALGHFIELKLGFDNHFYDKDSIPACVAEEMSRVIAANRNLEVLDLCDYARYLNWGPHLEKLFEGIRDHEGLRVLKLNVSISAFGQHFSYLRQLLSQNRNIVVINEDGNLYSDGLLIDMLYALNRFYRGLTNLAVHHFLERRLLVVIALLEGASTSFPCSALLLSQNVDVLYELVQSIELEEPREDDNCTSQSILSNNRKRRKTMQ